MYIPPFLFCQINNRTLFSKIAIYTLSQYRLLYRFFLCTVGSFVLLATKLYIYSLFSSSLWFSLLYRSFLQFSQYFFLKKQPFYESHKIAVFYSFPYILLMVTLPQAYPSYDRLPVHHHLHLINPMSFGWILSLSHLTKLHRSVGS